MTRNYIKAPDTSEEVRAALHQMAKEGAFAIHPNERPHLYYDEPLKLNTNQWIEMIDEFVNALVLQKTQGKELSPIHCMFGMIVIPKLEERVKSDEFWQFWDTLGPTPKIPV